MLCYNKNIILYLSFSSCIFLKSVFPVEILGSTSPPADKWCNAITDTDTITVPEKFDITNKLYRIPTRLVCLGSVYKPESFLSVRTYETKNLTCNSILPSYKVLRLKNHGGNSFFVVLSYFVNGKTEKHHEIRKEVVNYLKDNWNEIQNVIEGLDNQNKEDYINNMYLNNKSASLVEVYVAALLYSKSIIIYSKKDSFNNVLQIKKEAVFIPETTKEYIYLYYNDDDGNYGIILTSEAVEVPITND
ncbi:uncharacterized protein LOC142318225 [Lycorma delicatula]|uniref:uncharacterized protein LOC142318225 n=1 Tax=Lycorma delicatula TaxID=130591 RepID=UPI003F50F0CC